MLSQIDQVLFRLGKPGRFQVLVIFLLCCVQLQTSFNKYLLDFYTDPPPPHRCKAAPNATVGENELRPLVEEKGKKRYSSCEMYVDPTNHKLGTKNCINGWEYFTTEIEWTIIPEWDLVCEREYLVTLLPYLSCGGAIIGCLLFGMLADRFGRQRVLVTLLLIYTGSSVSLYFLSQFVFFSSIIGLEGFFITGVQCISYVLLMETVPTPYHLRLAFLVGAFWASGTLALTLVAYLIRHWRYIQLAISVPGVVSVTYFWLLPLSIPWLITKGRILPAENQIERLGHFNGVTLCRSFRLQIQNVHNFVKSSGNAARLTLGDIYSSAKLRRFVFVQYFIWFAVSLGSNIEVSEIPPLDENKFFRVLVRGVVEIGMLILVYLLSQRLGTKFIQVALLIGGGLLLISATTVEEFVLKGDENYQDDTLLVILPAIFSFFAKSTLQVATPLLFVHAVKTFPTGIRCLTLGTCVFWLHTAELTAPHLTWLSDHTTPYIPLTICGVLLIISGGLTLTLPTCQNRPLPNSLNEAEELEYNYSMHTSKDKSRYFNQDHSNSLFFTSSQSTNDISQGEIDAFRREVCHTKGVQEEEEQSLQYSETVFPVKGSVFFGSLRYARHEGMHEPRDDHDDSQSRLTDLEDELSKVWELNKHHSAPGTKEEGTSKDLDVFFGSNRRADWGMGETNF